MTSLAALVGLVALQLLTLAGLIAGAFAAGAAIAGRLAARPGAERFAIAVAAGLGVWGTALFWIGIAGGLRRAVVLALAAAALGTLVVLRWREWRLWNRWPRRNAPIGPGTESAGSRLAFAGAALALVPAFVATLYPPTAWDVTVYHLPFARAFVAAGRLVETPDLLFEIFPQLAETLFAALLAAARSDLAPALVQLVAVGAIAVLLFAAGERWISRRAGLWASALWLAHPLVHYEAAAAYVDAVQALFGLLALFAWERWREEAARPAGGARWLALAGAAAGWGASTKYQGLIWLALLGLATLLAPPPVRIRESVPRSRRALARLRAAALFALAAALFAAPWYARIWAATGNPFHPLFKPDSARGTLVGDTDPSQWTSAYSAVMVEPLPGLLVERVVAVARRPGDLARFAWDAAFTPARFDRQAPLAPWNLLLAPLAAAFALADARLRRWLLLVLGYALFWTTVQPRFQLTGAAVLALASAAALERLAARARPLGRLLARRSAALGLAVVLAAPGTVYAAYKVAKRGVAPPTRAAAREAYLEREVAGYAGIAWLERRHGSGYTVFLLGASNLTDFASGRVRGQTRGKWGIARVRPLLSRPAELHRELGAMDAGYLLVGRGFRPRPREDAAFRALFRRVEGDARHDLYELLPGQPPPAGLAPR